jgi:hypothetical protein
MASSAVTSFYSTLGSAFGQKGCNPGRQLALAPCPFDGKVLLLVDAEAMYSDDDSSLKPWLATPAVPKKG